MYVISLLIAFKRLFLVTVVIGFAWKATGTLRVLLCFFYNNLNTLSINIFYRLLTAFICTVFCHTRRRVHNCATRVGTGRVTGVHIITCVFGR